MIRATRPTPAINPTSAPTIFGDAFGRDREAASQTTLAATITLLSE